MAEALEQLQDAHEPHVEAFDWKARRPQGVGTYETIACASDACFRKLFEFHYELRYYVTEQQRQHYGPLLDARAEVYKILAEHPVWEPLVDLPDSDPELWIDVFQSGHLWSFLRMTCGLLARGIALGSDGSRVVSSELACLLDAEQVGWSNTDGNDLSIGYHIMLFHGVEVANRHKINEHMEIVPYGDFFPYIGKNLLERVVPDIVESGASRSVCAIVRRFHWKPKFSKYGSVDGRDETKPVTYLGDAYSFLELVSVLQSTPITSIVGIPSRIHHTAAMILGELSTYDSFGYQFISRQSFISTSTLPIVDESTLHRVGNLLKISDTERYQTYAPVIA